MKITQVSYTTSAEYADQNQANIKQVMADLRKLNSLGINYRVCLGADGQTFIHTACFQSDEDQKTLSELPSFQEFQKQLQASNLAAPPKQESLTLVDSSSDIF